MLQIKPKLLEAELQKNPELKILDIKILNEWCKKQPHLPKITDSELALFLHSNYYLIEPSKNTIDCFYTIRTHVPEFFANRDPLGNKDLRLAFNCMAILPLQTFTEEGYVIILGKLIDFNPANYVPNHLMKFFFMQLDLWLYSSGTTKGHIILFDVQQLSIRHAARVNSVIVKKFLYYLQEGLPVRLKGLHFMNSNKAMEVILNIVKPFLEKNLLEMLKIHSSLESLSKFIPIEALPNEMGGKAGPLMELHEAEIKKLEYNRDWFLEEESRARVDESKRPRKAKSTSDLFGVEGSFKKLDID